MNAFLQFNQKDILQDSGKVTAAIAKEFAEQEYEKYKPIQDKLFESDFDKELKKTIKEIRCLKVELYQKCGILPMSHSSNVIKVVP